MTNEEMFHWPIVTAEDENAVVAVLREGSMSGTNITKEFEREFAQWLGVEYALGTCNGTAALQEAFYACGVGPGTEVIAPSMTYWASCASVLGLGGKICFADIEPETLCMDPDDIEHRITPRTRVIVVVHYAGHPADMDRIMPIAEKHHLKVVEDVSHAQGGLYKGRKLGTIGDVGAMSLMAGKSFAIGEGGMLVTGDRKIFEYCMAFGHYERMAASRFSTPDQQLVCEELKPFAGVPTGGVKHRMNQTCSAMGRVQLKYYPERMAEIQRAMNGFWDLLEGVPGIRAHRVAVGSGSTMGGWYNPRGLFHAEELDGISCADFCAEAAAAGVTGCRPGANFPLHRHAFFASCGEPEALPWSDRIAEYAFAVPWFKHDDPAIIEDYAARLRAVAEKHAR